MSKRKHFSKFDTIDQERLKDVFPTKILNFNDVHSNDDDAFQKLSRETFWEHAVQAVPFILFKDPEEQIINYYGLEDEMVKYQDRLCRLLKDSKKLHPRTGTENLPWNKLEHCYNKLPVFIRKQKNERYVENVESSEREEHADQRLGFRFDNMFAVKMNFTFGERRTNPGEVHVIQTSEVPILYNEPKPDEKKTFDNHWKVKCRRKVVKKIKNEIEEEEYESSEREGRFNATDQQLYNTYILNPKSIYVIPENTVYSLITAQKTFFSLDRMTKATYDILVERTNVVFSYPNTHKQLLIEKEPLKKFRIQNNKRNSVDACKKWVRNDQFKPPKLVERFSIVELQQQQQQQMQLPCERLYDETKEIRFTPSSIPIFIEKSTENCDDTDPPAYYYLAPYQNNGQEGYFFKEQQQHHNVAESSSQHDQTNTDETLPQNFFSQHQVAVDCFPELYEDFGTCLVEQKPSTVVDGEHYFLTNGVTQNSGIPIDKSLVSFEENRTKREIDIFFENFSNELKNIQELDNFVA